MLEEHGAFASDRAAYELLINYRLPCNSFNSIDKPDGACWPAASLGTNLDRSDFVSKF